MAMTLLPRPTPLLLTVGVLLATAVPALATCPLSESVYRDVSGQGFELSWHDPLPDRASSKATLHIHRDGELLYHLTLTQASGYGTISLAVLNADLTPVNTPAFTLNFFRLLIWATPTPSFSRPTSPPPPIRLSRVWVAMTIPNAEATSPC
jgi:hypothetical protein